MCTVELLGVGCWVVHYYNLGNEVHHALWVLKPYYGIVLVESLAPENEIQFKRCIGFLHLLEVLSFPLV